MRKFAIGVREIAKGTKMLRLGAHLWGPYLADRNWRIRLSNSMAGRGQEDQEKHVLLYIGVFGRGLV